MKIGVFHPGTQHSWQTALALQQLDRLAWYATSIFYKPDHWPYRLERLVPGAAGRRLHAEFRRFSHPGLDPALVRTVGLTEWGERLATRAGMRGLARRLDTLGNQRFDRALRRELAAPGPLALWGYSGSALSTFVAARRLGRPCLLDRTIGDFRVYNAAMDEVASTHGDWFIPTERAVPMAQIERDQAEYETADTVLVGSEYAAGTIRAVAGDAVAAKLRVLHYCFDEALFAAQPAPRPTDRSAPVKFLFVGQVNPRKGIHHLLEAFAALPPSAAELTIVGDMRIPAEVFARHANRVRYIPTVARADIPRIMAAHHVLVFPSYFEGSALSLLEALASGMAIIQTRASGNGATAATGIVLDRPDTAALRDAMLTAIEDRTRLDGWRAAAQNAARTYSFTNYRDNIARLLDEMGI